ncbi:MAG TPA: TauD/TfdA family dioxygenase [Candidatus Marinimicrobia bacterium]|jgi:alpha-ketoglutarate-dependent taurine dioxygenase|nr:TauD/TfdA family dioxygenase [Candidatus Neomarinimicrobiota bacterium]|tara:strand:- start:59 stop:967 length:909 start_codon:yes stop_codon:yes gene_type:complete
MKTTPITDNWGAIITPTKNKQLLEINRNEIISLFERKGIILFRGFDLDQHDILTFTNQFTERYSRPDYRRSSRFEQEFVLDADYWKDSYRPYDMPLHSETTFTPVWPEVIWLYCNVPPAKEGATTVCDGIEIWDRMSSEIKLFFLAEPVLYVVEIPIPETIKGKGKGKKPWISDMLGVGGYLDWDADLLCLNVLRYAANKARYSDKFCFSNHLLADLHDELQIKEITMASGKAIPEKFIDEIKQVSDDITVDHSWQQGDVVMVDNIRFMHGRRAFEKGDPRDILTVQTARASFGFSSDTRPH